MAKTEYQKKLLDPKWQKKRLKILERDEFRCQICGDDESTLHVHHKYYSSGDPWEIKDAALVCLCASCHEEETASLKESKDRLIRALAEFGANSYEFGALACVLEDAMDRTNARISAPQSFAAFENLLLKVLCYQENWDALIENYFDELKGIKQA